MLGFLKKIFRPSEPLAEVAMAGDPQLFAETFYETDVFLMAAPTPGASLDPANATEDELLELIESSAEAAAAEEETTPLMLQVDGVDVLPVFSSMDTVEVFGQEYARLSEMVTPLLSLGISGRHVVDLLDESMKVVLNPLSDSEVELPPEYLEALRALQDASRSRS